VFWIVGIVALGIVLVRALRAERRPMALPRPSAGCISTVVAWIVIVAISYVVLVRQH
jgi:hypothetical protein